jgi:glycosyltransferase involved in cell wall biosynthesis
MSLRIAMVGACPYPVPQGSQVFLRENALALQSKGHEVHLVVYGHGIGEDTTGLTIHRCRRLPWDARISAGPSLIKPFLDFALLMTLRRVIHEQRIDLVCAHNYEALLIALAAGKKPILYHAHNAMSDELPQYFRHKALPFRFGRWLDHTFPRRADRTVVPHRRLAGHLIVRGCAHDRVTIVPPPIDVRQFEPSAPGKELPPVLYTGNLDPYQNLGLLFAAVSRVRKVKPAAQLIVATADEAHLPEAKRVPTPDFDALRQVLAQDAIFALPRVSWSGYPIKLLNAMAAGKAIVACEGASYPLTHGQNGLVVPDNDERAFADAILQLMDDYKLRAELGRHARETVTNEYRPETVADQLDRIANEVVSSRIA